MKTANNNTPNPKPEAAGWLIFSREHNRWWRPNSQGYTEDRTKAGRYDFVSAVQICKNANRYLNINDPPEETMLPDL